MSSPHYARYRRGGMRHSVRLRRAVADSFRTIQKDQPQGLGEAGYSPRRRFIALPLTSELVDGFRSNANQRTAEQCLAESANPQPYKKTNHQGWSFCMVGEAGFGPAKSVTTDLQSAPFGRSGIPPYKLELVNGVEPSTC